MYISAAHVLMTAYHRGLTKATDIVLRNWVAQPARSPASVRELVRYTQDEIHSVKDIEGRFREVEATQVTDLDRRIAFLNVLVVSAPLFGCAGDRRLYQPRAVRPIADRLGCSMAQLALAWCASNPHVSTVITGASRVGQVHDNFAALDVIPLITADVKAEIEEAVRPR
jgi:diketogulonate reductase-like aldo/keto reductase